jgi:hypothetical protein
MVGTRHGRSAYLFATSTTWLSVRSTRSGSASRRRNRGTTLASSHCQRSSNRVILGIARVLSAAASPPVSEYAENDVKYLSCCRRPCTSKVVVEPIDISRAKVPDIRSKSGCTTTRCSCSRRARLPAQTMSVASRRASSDDSSSARTALPRSIISKAESSPAYSRCGRSSRRRSSTPSAAR